MNIYEKLQSARVELQNKKLKKSGKNKGIGFEYFELNDFLPSINEIFLKVKLFSHFGMNKEVATLSIMDVEKPEDIIIFQMPVAKLDLRSCNEIQALGGVNTYLKRYLYLNALEIVEADLFDAETGKDNKPKKPDIDADFDIIAGLTGIADIKSLEVYYKQNKNKVKDIKAFNVAVNARKEAITTKGAVNDNV